MLTLISRRFPSAVCCVCDSLSTFAKAFQKRREKRRVGRGTTRPCVAGGEPCAPRPPAAATASEPSRSGRRRSAPPSRREDCALALLLNQLQNGEVRSVSIERRPLRFGIFCHRLSVSRRVMDGRTARTVITEWPPSLAGCQDRITRTTTEPPLQSLQYVDSGLRQKAGAQLLLPGLPCHTGAV